MSDEAWIEQALARLEELETKRAQIEAQGEGESASAAAVQAEISALYEALERVASDEADDEDDDERSAPASDSAGAMGRVEDELPSGYADHPFGSPIPAAAAPMAAPAPAMAYDDEAGFDAPMGGYDDDLKPPRSKGPLIAAAALLVAGIGVGGYFMMNKQAATPSAPAAVGEPRVITASSIPEDTQEPDAAVGVQADRTPERDFAEGEASKPQARSGSGDGKRRAKRRRASRDDDRKRDDGRRVKVESSNDPLAGL